MITMDDELARLARIEGANGRLLTEDLQHGVRIRGVMVLEPFVVAPGDELSN